jgi:hypothetical protein
MEEEYQYWEEDEQYQGEQYYEEPQGYSEDWLTLIPLTLRV